MSQYDTRKLLLKKLLQKKFVITNDNGRILDIDPNMKDHAQFCAEELYTAVKDKKYEMALSFLRGFRDVFTASNDPDIRRLFVCKC